ncbi:MAG: response regulator [Planctomycetes bacterium]|nr:response regulator [Planctomycetota bacterium]
MPTIMVVEDDRQLLEVMAHFLEVRGFDVHSASCGYEALAILSATGVDLVITDINMPRMNGLELANRIAGAHPGLPVIAYTADPATARSSNFAAVMSKPSSFQDILETINAYLPPVAAASC